MDSKIPECRCGKPVEIFELLGKAKEIGYAIACTVGMVQLRRIAERLLSRRGKKNVLRKEKL